MCCQPPCWMVLASRQRDRWLALPSLHKHRCKQKGEERRGKERTGEERKGEEKRGKERKEGLRRQASQWEPLCPDAAPKCNHQVLGVMKVTCQSACSMWLAGRQQIDCSSHGCLADQDTHEQAVCLKTAKASKPAWGRIEPQHPSTQIDC